MKCDVYLLGDRRRDYCRKIFLRRGSHALDASERPQQGFLTGRPHSGHLVKDRIHHALVPYRPVIGNRESMRLIAYPLQQVQSGFVASNAHRLRTAWQVHLLHPLGQPGHRNIQPQFVEDLFCPTKLSYSSVDEQQTGRIGELAAFLIRQFPLGQVRHEPTADHLFHGRKSSCWLTVLTLKRR